MYTLLNFVTILFDCCFASTGYPEDVQKAEKNFCCRAEIYYHQTSINVHKEGNSETVSHFLSSSAIMKAMRLHCLRLVFDFCAFVSCSRYLFEEQKVYVESDTIY